ncbi:MAG: GNAT family N-acetyltransferase [Micromonosporaceae bacterium]
MTDHPEVSGVGADVGLRARPFISGRDADAVLALVNADRLRGQPEATLEMLAEAVAGHSAIDAGWWIELNHPVAVDVVEDAAGAVVGVVSYATRPRDGAGLILWLHGEERLNVVAALVDHALAELGDRQPVDAFDFSTALGLGFEALPVHHRPVTAAVLSDRGFASRDLWRYMHRHLPAPELPHAAAYSVEPPDPGKRRLTVRDGDQVSAEAIVGVPVAGIGVLWWLSVDGAARGRGIGRALLGSALDLLAGLGAAEVILYVDDDEPGGERDRAAANKLYESAGFTEVDRLHSFRRSVASDA